MREAGWRKKEGMKEENAMRDLRVYPLGLPSAGLFCSFAAFLPHR